MPEDSAILSDFNGLAKAEPSLPTAWYSDPAHFALELSEIWGRSWLLFCRSAEIAAPNSWHAGQIAGRNVLAVRRADGTAAAFHNVCRHRGAEICPAGRGQLDRPLLVCPYHQWSYRLDGSLVATGLARRVEGFDRSEHGLAAIACAEWGGYVFINLDAEGATSLDGALGAELAPLANWPLAELQVAHRDRIEIACNWKVFWENFNECLHCPGIHPELCDLVPIYGRGIMVAEDDPDWRGRGADGDPRHTGRLREGAESWTEGGAAQGAPLPGLTPDNIARGHTYAVALPSVFVVGHRDYARSVRVLPLGPERTELTVEWLLPAGWETQPGLDLDAILRFSSRVLRQDAAACEMNQRGLSAAPFASGTLMQEEYEVHAFHQWVRARLGEAVAPPASRASRRKPRS
ncbi:MAG TPA: aromatic ring-hydroxylating dioxygenase subunit alpha [Thermohalobaculum sp.]|nr:aromatic ring-hydroxylating dioxygenase subunit alpha [Thermohalobaculum sp.]